jgi:hypothetical protein
MVYLIFSSLQGAQDRSQAICQQQGCTGDITTYWFSCIENKNTLEGAMVVPEDQESLLTSEEISELKNEQYMIDNGWIEVSPF